MRLHFSEHHRYQGKPLYEAIVQKCLEMKIAGATVLRGLEGYGGMAQIHRPHLLKHDLPTVVTIVDTAENIARLQPVLETMMETGMIAVSDVQMKRIQKGEAANVPSQAKAGQ
jgi:PII-like signaling protein